MNPATSRHPSRRDVLRWGLRTSMLMAAGAGLASTTACGDAATDGQVTPDTRQVTHRWGAFIPQVLPSPGSKNAPLERLAQLAGAPAAYIHRFVAIDVTPSVAELNAIADSGATPLLTLEPWRPGEGVIQPAYSLRRVANGDFDDQLARWASTLRTFGRPVLLRFAQEMNGDWYPWSVGVNGNTAAHYRDAWRRVHEITHSDNVSFVWSPNVITLGTTDFTPMFPGDGLVDRLGLDGYNFGDVPGHHWQPARELFASSLDKLSALGPALPMLITEVASAEGPAPGLKADWIRDFFSVLDERPQVAGFVWFQMDKERDWRFNSTVPSAEAFRESLQNYLSR